MDKSTSPRPEQIQIRRLQLGDGVLEVFSSTIYLILARSLREIKFYQSAATAEDFMIRQAPFQRVVREISQDVKANLPGGSHFAGGYRWERDAVFALQTMSEHILIMVFEMM